jgi:hypothetical protein
VAEYQAGGCGKGRGGWYGMWGRGYGEGGRGNSHSAVHDWQLTDRCCWVVGNPVYLWISGKVDMPSLMYVSLTSPTTPREDE